MCFDKRKDFRYILHVHQAYINVISEIITFSHQFELKVAFSVLFLCFSYLFYILVVRLCYYLYFAPPPPPTKSPGQ